MHINEFSLDVRYKLKNVVIGGFWFGAEPVMNVFFRPFMKELKSLYNDAINVCKNGIMVTYKILPLFCSLDIIAKKHVQNFKQFNGKFGCGYCLHPGEIFSNSNNSKYTIKNNIELRTHNSTVNLMKRHQIKLVTLGIILRVHQQHRELLYVLIIRQMNLVIVIVVFRLKMKITIR